MKVLVLLLALVGVGSCMEACYDSVVGACLSGPINDLPDCNAKYGAINEVESQLQKYVNDHIAYSFDFLLMSTYFGNYKINRHGFEGLFRKLSDKTWSDSTELAKYIAKRGGAMQFDKFSTRTGGDHKFEKSELHSLAEALDAQKAIAKEAHSIHKEVSRNREHDPEVASFLENRFVHRHADTIRELAGHITDLKTITRDRRQASLAVFLFDEYLQKL